MLKKCVGAPHGASRKLVSQIASVESPATTLDAQQARLMGKLMRNPDTISDLIDLNPQNKGSGRGWDEVGRKAGKGYESILTAIIEKAGRRKGNECEEISWGGKVKKVEIEKADLKLGKEDEIEEWKLRIFEAGDGRTTVFTDGSKSGGKEW